MTRPSAASDSREPTVVEEGVDAELAADLRRFRGLSHLLDDSMRVPGTSVRIGVEPLVGLLPVVGDLLGVTVAAYALAIGARAGLPRATLARIAVVYWIDGVVGAVPLLGDVFDVFWKANRRSVRLVDARLADPAGAAADRRFLWRVGLAAVALGLVVIAALAGLAWWLLGAL